MKSASGKVIKLPNDAFVNVTWRCNSRCIMCDSWKRSPGEELKPDEYSKLPKSLKFINISGGEPFLRDDLFEIIQVIHRNNNAEICISTNGFASERIEKQMSEIIKLKAKVRVNISVDGIGERHNEVRGVKNAFNMALTSLDVLKRIGVKDIGLAHVTTNRNTNQLQDVMKLAKKLKVELTVCGVANNSQIHLSGNNAAIHDMDELKRQYAHYNRQQVRTFSIREWGRAYFNSGTPYYAATGSRKIPCFAGSAFFFMTPGGDIYPDMVLDYKLGNISNQQFEEIWRSQRAEEFRKSIVETGFCSTPCWMNCTVFPWMKRHKVRCATWFVENKIRAHLGLSIKPVQG